MKFSCRSRVCLFVLLQAFWAHATAEEIPKHGLSLVYSVDRLTCDAAAVALRNDKSCRTADASKCSDIDERSVLVNEMVVPVIEELATNEYGYTTVARSTSSSLARSVIVYVSKFQGDRSPRLLETWKVDAKALKEVLALPPGPVPYAQWVDLNPKHSREIHSQEFAALLVAGEKITDEWSPVLGIAGKSYAVKRECSGLWAYGGLYVCNRVIKLTLLRLADEQEARPVCQFAKRKQK